MNLEPGAQASPPIASNETAQRFFDLTGDMLAVLEADGRIVEVNATFADIIGCEQSQIIGRPLTEILVPVDPSIFTAQNELLGETRERVDFELSARVGARRMALIASLDLDAATSRRFLVARDISEQRRLSAQLESRGQKDEMGGLSNRHVFNDAIDLELKMGGNVAIIHILMGGMDEIATEHGELVTSELLQAAVSRMRRNLRDSDVMARFSKAEFAVMLTGDKVKESAERLGVQLAESLRRAFGVKGSRIDVISAVGIAVGDGTSHSPAELLTEAGKAVQEARQTGNTCAVVFGQAGLAAIATSGRANDDLRTALAQADQYGVNVQGIFTADGSGAMGVEALLTRLRPALRRLTDDSDDEVLEAITIETATEVFASIGPWLAAHRTRRVCMNIAAPQLASTELFATMAAVAKANLLEPRQVVCELSEATLGDGAVSPQRMTEEIRRHGFQLSIDNFGTETASLANLRSLEAGYVKLDPSLVSSLFTSDFHSALIRSVVDVARTMGISVIANGVQNQQQLEAVRKIGCSFVQGPGVHASESLRDFSEKVS